MQLLPQKTRISHGSLPDIDLVHVQTPQNQHYYKIIFSNKEYADLFEQFAENLGVDNEDINLLLMDLQRKTDNTFICAYVEGTKSVFRHFATLIGNTVNNRERTFFPDITMSGDAVKQTVKVAGDDYVFTLPKPLFDKITSCNSYFTAARNNSKLDLCKINENILKLPKDIMPSIAKYLEPATEEVVQKVQQRIAPKSRGISRKSKGISK